MPTCWLLWLTQKPLSGEGLAEPLENDPWRLCAPDSPAHGLRVPGRLPGKLFYVPEEQG